MKSNDGKKGDNRRKINQRQGFWRLWWLIHQRWAHIEFTIPALSTKSDDPVRLIAGAKAQTALAHNHPLVVISAAFFTTVIERGVKSSFLTHVILDRKRGQVFILDTCYIMV